jgi:hypothetical protein
VFTFGVQITAAFRAVQPVFEEKSVCGAHKRVAKPLNFPYAACMNMGSFFSFFLFFLLCLPLCGCGGGTGGPRLTPLAYSPAEPGETLLMDSVRGFLQRQSAPAQTQFEYGLFDLNGDGMRDALVYLKSPYGFWCAMEGCALLVMKAEERGFSPVTLIRPVRNPVYIGAERHEGWHDLAVLVAGGEALAAESVLRFDGNSYPSSPPLPVSGGFSADLALRKFFP